MSGEFDLGPAVEDAANVLLVAPGIGNDADRLCCDVMSADGTVPEHVIGVTIAASPREMIQTVRDRLGPGPEITCFTVDGVSRSAARATAPAEHGATIEHIESASRVRQLGERVAVKIDRDTETALCFDSVTELEECLGQETAFEFLHVLGSRVRAGGATGYYYIDRSVHGEETMTLYSTLFDAVVEAGPVAGDGAE